VGIAVEITPNASKALLKLAQNPLADYIRIFQGSSCGCGKGGFQMQWDDHKRFSDTVIKTSGPKLVVDRNAKAQLHGGTIDYSDVPMTRGFRIVAPNAVPNSGSGSGCGCGGSH
jgi:iron-sulfur cluster assembly accessory protein